MHNGAVLPDGPALRTAWRKTGTASVLVGSVSRLLQRCMEVWRLVREPRMGGLRAEGADGGGGGLWCRQRISAHQCVKAGTGAAVQRAAVGVQRGVSAAQASFTL